MRREVILMKDGEQFYFDSIKQAAKFADCSTSLISNVIAGRRSTANGYSAKLGERIRVEKPMESDIKVGFDIDG